MKKTSKTINCCIRKTGHDKARIAFEIQTPLRHDSTRTEILREFQENNELNYCPEGLLLVPGTTRTLIAITHAHRGNVITIRIFNNVGARVQQSHFRISTSFEPQPIHRADLCAASVPRDGIEADDGTRICMEEGDLKRLFSDRHPTWLQTSINTTLDWWREENPELFLRVAPCIKIAQQAALLVRHQPERALEVFKNDLDDELLRICINRRPEAAIRHAFERIPRADRIGLVRKFSTFVLDHHLDRLTELELEVASGADAMTAFKLRHFLDDRRHALLLAKSYPAAFFSEPREKRSELEAEIRRSVIDHPRIWRRAHYRSFGILFRSLESTLAIRFSGEELLELIDSLGPKLRKELQFHLASKI